MELPQVITDSIRSNFLGEYYWRARNSRPGRALWQTAHAAGSMMGIIGGVLGGVLFGASLPVALVVAGGGVVLAGATVASSMLLERADRKIASGLLEKDIDNFTLVKRYLNELLPKEQTDLDQRRLRSEQSYRELLADYDRRQAQIDAKRADTLQTLANNVGTLEEKIRVSVRELDDIKQQARTVLGEDFDAALQKPQAEPTAQQQPAPRGGQVITTLN